MIDCGWFGSAEAPPQTGEADPAADPCPPEAPCAVLPNLAGRPPRRLFTSATHLWRLLWPELVQSHARGAPPPDAPPPTGHRLESRLIAWRAATRPLGSRRDRAVGRTYAQFDEALGPRTAPKDALALYRGDFLPAVLRRGARRVSSAGSRAERVQTCRPSAATRAAWLAFPTRRSNAATRRGVPEWGRSALVRLAPG
jgi:hypothetical protein